MESRALLGGEVQLYGLISPAVMEDIPVLQIHKKLSPPHLLFATRVKSCLGACLQKWLKEGQGLAPKERQRVQPRGTHTLALTSMTWAWIGNLMSGTELQNGKKLPAAMYARLLGLCEEPVAHVEDRTFPPLLVSEIGMSEMCPYRF